MRSTLRSGPYTHIGSAPVPDSVYVDNTTQIYQRYFYYIQAVTDENLLSDPSDTLDYKLIRKATGLTPSGEIGENKPEFSWEDTNNPIQPAYLLRLFDLLTEDTIWFVEIPSSYSTREKIMFNADGLASVDSLQIGVEYVWRLDILSSEDRCGSESQWVTFRVR
jgi:hypothetical protein